MCATISRIIDVNKLLASHDVKIYPYNVIVSYIFKSNAYNQPGLD